MTTHTRHSKTPARAIRGRAMVLGLLAAAGLAGSGPARAQSLTLANPDWNITLTDAGYSDFLLDNTPGFEGREYLSGEWGAAVAYQVAGNAPVAPQWLERQFSYPNWTTSSTFDVTSPIVQVGLNAQGLPIAESVIANPDLEITLRHEMIDTVVGVPMGTTAASAGGAGSSIRSSRYVLKQTCTLRNISGSAISGLQFFQLLHGLHSQRGVYDNRPYPGPSSEFQHDLTLVGVDPWAVGAGSSSSGLEDTIGFHASIAPSAYEVGHYGIEGNGVDDHWSAKPTDGVHLSVEANWQTPPFNTRLGTDSFAPPQLWVAGAQRWELGSLGAGQSASLDLLLSIRTGTRVDPGTGSSGGCNGGSGVPGGLDYEFEDVSDSGSCFADYSQADDAEISVRVADGEFTPLSFPKPGEPAQVWTVEFTGAFLGSVQLTVGYDASILPPGFDEESLCLYQFAEGAWSKLPGTVHAVSNTVSVTTTQLGPLALGAQSSTLFTVSAAAAPPGSGTVLGTGSFVGGASVSVSAIPAAGQAFLHWTEGGEVVSTSPSYTFTILADRTLLAHFVAAGGTAKTVSTTSSPASGGTTLGDGAYEPGTLATVVATPAPGYKFSKWREGDVEVSTSATYSFTVNGDRQLVAKFKPVYTLTLGAEPADAGEVEGDPQYEIGELAKLKAKPNTGYAFVHWTQNGNPVSTDPNFQFAMTGNRELVGHFALGMRVDLSSIPPHAGTTTGAGVHTVGSPVVVEAHPEPGYVFVEWTEDDAPVSADAAYAFTSADTRTLVAHFALAPAAEGGPIPGNDTVHRLPRRALKIPVATLLGNDSSPNGLPLSIVAVDAVSAEGGRVALVGGWVVFEPAPDSTATDSFQYSLSDGSLQALGSVTILLDPEPVSPTLNIIGSSLLNSGGTEAMQIRAAGIPGRFYRLQATASLAAPVTWSDLGPAVAADRLGEATLLDEAPASPRFYRVLETP